MRYKKVPVDSLLDAMDAEVSVARHFGCMGKHLDYIHMLVRELRDSLRRSKPRQRDTSDVSAIEYVFRKLEYE